MNWHNWRYDVLMQFVFHEYSINMWRTIRFGETISKKRKKFRRLNHVLILRLSVYFFVVTTWVLWWTMCFFSWQVKLAEKTSSLEAAEFKIKELTAKINDQQKLIQKLEDDIQKVGSIFFFLFLFMKWPLVHSNQC